MAKKELFKDLVSIGKKQGYLTYDQINEKLSEKDLSPDKLDSFYIRLAELGIKTVDKNSSVSVSTSSASSSKKEKNQPETADIVVKSNEDEEINPVRMYLTEMAKVPLLERNVEVELAKNVKENEKKLTHIVLESPLIIKEIKSWDTLIEQEEMTPKELMPRGRKSTTQLRNMRIKVKQTVQRIGQLEKNIAKIDLKAKQKGLSQKEKIKLDTKRQALRAEIISLIVGLNLNQDKIKRLINKIKTTANKLNEINSELERMERSW